MLNQPQPNPISTNTLKTSFEANKNTSQSQYSNQYPIPSTINKPNPKPKTQINYHKTLSQQKTTPNIEHPSTNKKKYKRQQSLENDKIEFFPKNNEKQQKQSQSSQNKNLFFQELIIHGMNIPQMIAHTILPRIQSKPKLYQDTKQIKQNKITIPVKIFDQSQQSFSPLLKRKKQNQSNLSPNTQNKNKNQQMESIIFFNQQNNKNQECPMLMKDQQANSLALLIQSLPLEAHKAIHLLQAALKYANNNLSAAQYLSYLYLETKKPKLCLELCNQILQQIKQSPQANELSIHIKNNKAAALNQLGRYSQSIGILQECLSYKTKDISYKNLADSYFSISIYQKAILNYQKAIEINNLMDQAYYNLAVTYYVQKNINQAKFNVDKAIQLNPQNPQYLELQQQINLKLIS